MVAMGDEIDREDEGIFDQMQESTLETDFLDLVEILSGSSYCMVVRQY
jgi:hypothetical protein